MPSVTELATEEGVTTEAGPEAAGELTATSTPERVKLSDLGGDRPPRPTESDSTDMVRLHASRRAHERGPPN